jgi:hypothetical protein
MNASLNIEILNFARTVAVIGLVGFRRMVQKLWPEACSNTFGNRDCLAPSPSEVNPVKTTNSHS